MNEGLLTRGCCRDDVSGVRERLFDGFQDLSVVRALVERFTLQQQRGRLLKLRSHPLPLVDPGGARDARPFLSGSNFLRFHAIF